MKEKERVDIVGFPQEDYYTCGCACFRTALNSLGMKDVDELILKTMMGTTYQSGTHYDLMIEAASKFNLQVKSGHKGNFKELDNLLDDGWVVIICYTTSGPHYSVYMGNNKNHLFLYDPDVDKKTSYPMKKFIRNNWKVDISQFKEFINEYNLVMDESYNSNRWWVAYGLLLQ